MSAVGAPAGSVGHEELGDRRGAATAIHDPRSCEAKRPWHQNPVDNQQFESFPELHETPEEIAFELRAQEGALWTGGRLLIGIWAFAFAALAFAYFYLRSANNEDLWRPGGITAPTAAGAAIFAITVACALLVQFGERRFRNNETLGLAGGRLDGRPRRAARHRPPDLAADGRSPSSRDRAATPRASSPGAP